MDPFDPKLHEKLRNLENLDEIEVRLARHEKTTRITLIVVMVLAAIAFAMLLGHIVSPDWLPLGH